MFAQNNILCNCLKTTCWTNFSLSLSREGMVVFISSFKSLKKSFIPCNLTHRISFCFALLNCIKSKETDSVGKEN